VPTGTPELLEVVQGVGTLWPAKRILWFLEDHEAQIIDLPALRRAA